MKGPARAILPSWILQIVQMRFDSRPTLSRPDARAVYDGFAAKGHIGGNDASSGYGGPAVQALLTLAAFSEAKTVLDYGCGQGKLAELALSNHQQLVWRGVDQSPLMVQRAQERLHKFGARSTTDLLEDGDPSQVAVKPGTVDRFVSTYCLDLLSERDMYGVLDTAERSLHSERGLLLLSGITWGYRDSIKTFFMTLIWEVLYRVTRKTVGGCRPQNLEPYLRARGWTIVRAVRTLPNGVSPAFHKCAHTSLLIKSACSPTVLVRDLGEA